MSIKSDIVLAFVLHAAHLCAQIPAPAPEQSGSVLLMHGIAHTADGRVIGNSLIGFEKGKIILVADASTVQVDEDAYDQVIQIPGKHVYPGLIAPNSTLGLTEIGQVRATHDFKDVGRYNPELRSIIAYNTESRITPTVRSNGILIAQITPRGGIISGTSSIVQLDAWNWEDAVVKSDEGIHLNWPAWKPKGYDLTKKKLVEKQHKAHNRKIDELQTFFLNAKAYSQIDDPDERNIRYESMRGLFSGDITLYIHANYAKDILEAIAFVRSFNLKKVVLVGGYDAWKLCDMLKENHIPVVLRRIHSLPMRTDEDPDLPYKLPHLLQQAGVLFCLDNSGDMEAMETRNLPFMAGTAVAYGLTKEQALMSITSNAAKILGIEDQVGMLREGMQATLFVSDGDALDMRTNKVVYAFIQGRQIDLDNPQKYLYRKYKAHSMH